MQRKDLEGLEVPARTGKGLYLSCLWVNLSGSVVSGVPHPAHPRLPPSSLMPRPEYFPVQCPTAQKLGKRPGLCHARRLSQKQDHRVGERTGSLRELPLVLEPGEEPHRSPLPLGQVLMGVWCWVHRAKHE